MWPEGDKCEAGNIAIQNVVFNCYIYTYFRPRF